MEPAERPTLKKCTTVLLPVGLLAEIDRLRAELGVSRSALLALAATRFVVETVPALTPVNRAESLSAIEQIFIKLLAEARETV
jgi:hypothetical protein